MSMAILTPSRGRPDRYADMLYAARSLAEQPGELTFYLYLDEDDPERDGYATEDVAVEVVVGPRLRFTRSVNRLAERALRDSRHTGVIGVLGDDVLPRTPGWDVAIRSAMTTLGGGLVWCADDWQDDRLPTHPFWDSRVIEAVGFYVPSCLVHMYGDDYWRRLGRDLGRWSYLPDVLIEHMHPDAGKAALDPSYQQSAAEMQPDAAAWRRFVDSDDYDRALARAKTVYL